MDEIVLLAKQPGITSFGALRNVKKALNTNKVGHTGTLDSFAQGLLVICTGRMTRLAGNITEFDKSYKAVIKFGEETDTLEYTGNVIKQAELPSKQAVIDAVAHFTGEQDQIPPAFSAIHVDGKRASDLTRNGQVVELKARKITVFSAKIEEFKMKENEDKVEACLIDFSVSKGTYIRSLARDIGNYCGSCAHLIGLFRTKVGNFCVENAAGYSLIPEFTIDSSYKDMEKFKAIESDFVFNKEDDLIIQQQILETKQQISKDIAEQCGFMNISLSSQDSVAEFCNGKPLKNRLFVEDLYSIPNNQHCSVFYEDIFYGLIYKDETGKIRYKFVNN